MGENTNELLEILKSIDNSLQAIKQQDTIKMLSAKDVSKILGINVNSATELLKRDDIPSIKIGNLKIEESALKSWLQEKREKN